MKSARKRKKQNRRTAPRLIVCPRCDLEKQIRARGVCNGCYMKFRRNGILHRLGPVRTEHMWNKEDLAYLKQLRDRGLTVRECVPHFPSRSYWSLRLCCVQREYVRGGRAGQMARLEAAIAKRLPTMPPALKPGFPAGRKRFPNRAKCSREQIPAGTLDET